MKVEDRLQRLCDQLANMLLVGAIVLVCIAVYCWLDDVSYKFSKIGLVFVDKFYVEVVSVLFTVGVLGLLNRVEARGAEKRRLIQQMSSPSNDFVLEAVRILRLEGWLQDGSLERANLQKANLKDADLVNASLVGADFTGATLTGASLQGAMLTGATITLDQLREVAKTPDGLRGTTLPDGKLLPYKDDVSYDGGFEAWCKGQEQK